MRKGIFGFFAGNTVDGLAYNMLMQVWFCVRLVSGWHVRCWCGLRELENAGEASPCVEISKNYA